MHRLAWVCVLLALGPASRDDRPPTGRVIAVSSADALADALRAPLSGVTVQLAPGTYSLTAASAFDSLLDGCRPTQAMVPVTVGLTISGRGVRLVGPDRGDAVIVTRAGYGIHFKDCTDCGLERFTITGAVRDSTAGACNAAVVATRSSVRIAQCVIRDNLGDPWGHGEVGGICGRDGAELTIEYNNITGNTWHAISLQRGASAVIRHNRVEGAKRAGPASDGPHHAAIDVDCNARATVEHNHLRRCGGGIRVSGHAEVVADANVIEEMDAWGVGVWGAPRIVIEKNVVYDCGASGIVVDGEVPTIAEARGRVSRNLVVHTAQNPKFGPESAGALSLPGSVGFVIRDNTGYDTREVAGSPDRDAPREMFWRARRKWTRTYRNTPVGVDGRHKFHESAFLTRYGRWLN